MITRLTDTEPESWPTVDPETIVKHAVEDGADITDEAPIGWYGGALYPNGVLELTYRKHGNHFADQEDENGETVPEHADTKLTFVTLERVIELFEALPLEESPAVGGTRAWVLDQINPA